MSRLKIFHPAKKMPKTISKKLRRRGMTPKVQSYLKGGKKLPTNITQKDSDALTTAFTGTRKGHTQSILAAKGIVNTWGPVWQRKKAITKKASWLKPKVPTNWSLFQMAHL